MASENKVPDGRNRLLEALPDAVQARIREHGEEVDVELRDILVRENERLEHVYFPLSGVISLLTRMDEGQDAEIATVGNEGFVGLPVIFGAEVMNPRELAQVQVPGRLLKIEASFLRQETRDVDQLYDVVQRYAHAFLSQVAQQVACNGLHSLEERCCRWLLFTHDRVRADEFPLTQEFLAQMLGVRRPSVTVVAGILQRAGLIKFRRGRLTILDREGLEEASCECYGVIREVYDRLIP